MARRLLVSHRLAAFERRALPRVKKGGTLFSHVVFLWIVFAIMSMD